MFTLTVYLVQHAVIAEMMQNAPPGMPNVFLLDIPGRAAPGAHGSVEAAEGRRDRARDSGSGGGAAHRRERRADREFGLAGFRPALPAHPLGDHAVAVKPAETEILSGAWWNAGAAEPQVCA